LDRRESPGERLEEFSFESLLKMEDVRVSKR
jgi:hypothetical protein